MNWLIIAGAFFILGGIGNIFNNFGAFLFGVIIGVVLMYFGLKKAGLLKKSQFKKKHSAPVTAKQRTLQPTSMQIPTHYIVFDIETTGFSRNNDRIIEIAASEYRNGSVLRTFHTFVNPGTHIPNGITRLTGIRDADVIAAPRIQSVKTDFLSFIGDMTLVGHNINTFDIPFLEAQFNCRISNNRIDTLHLAKRVFPGLPSYKLSVLDQILQLGRLEHHRAENDIIVNNALLLACAAPQKYKKRINDPDVLNNITIEHRDIYSGKVDIKSITPTDPSQIPHTKLTGKNIVFSGELSILPEEAYQIAVDAGAILKSNVSKRVDYLVLGTVDPRFIGEDGMSSKQRTARELIRSGESNIRIINESEFLSLATPE